MTTVPTLAAVRHDVSVTRSWMRDGEAFFAARLAALSDADLDGPSALPGWDRRTIVAHVARNAEALTRLLSWARTGAETPMYADAGQRAREIEASARQPAAELRTDLRSTASALDAAAAQLSAAQWQAGVRSARRREIPAAEVPWMRCREVWLHGLDLAARTGGGDGPQAMPEPFAEALVEELAEYMAAQPGVPPTEVVSAGSGRSLRFGGATGGRGPVARVSGDPRVLALWLTGRPHDPAAVTGDPPPELPAWL